jgi:hypothetical protein
LNLRYTRKQGRERMPVPLFSGFFWRFVIY